MANWMQDHFKEPAAAPRAKPKAGLSGWLATIVLLGLAVAVVGSVAAAVHLSRKPAEVAQAIAAPPAPTISEPLPVASARPPAAALAPSGGTIGGGGAVEPAVAAPAKPAAAPKGMSTLINHIDEHRDGRAEHLRWLDACLDKRGVEKARAAVQASRDDAAKWKAQTSLKQLLDQVEHHQREVARYDELCDTAEARLVKACGDAGYPVPKVANPSTTWDNTPKREKRRPDLHQSQSALRMPRAGEQAPMGE